MHLRRPRASVAPRPKRAFWDRWTTRVAVITVLLAILVGGVCADGESAPGYTPWQNTASTVLRQLGFGPALDTYANWTDDRQDVRGMMATGDPSAATK